MAIFRAHQLAVLMVLLVAAWVCFAVVPAQLCYGVIQAALLALVALAGVVLVRGVAGVHLWTFSFEEQREGEQRLGLWAAYVLLAGLAAGLAALWISTSGAGSVGAGAGALGSAGADALGSAGTGDLSASFSGGIGAGAGGSGGSGAGSLYDSAQADPQSVGWFGYLMAFVIGCFLTGVFEEGVFRVVAVGAFAAALRERTHAVLKAAMLASVFFGLLHVSIVETMQTGNALLIAQAAAKLLQAALFGFFMAGLYVRTRNLWVLAGVHGVFNLLYLGPLAMVSGTSTTYLSGSAADLALTCLTVVLLVPAAWAAWQYLLQVEKTTNSQGLIT